MKARVIKNPVYPADFTVGEIYPVMQADDGVNYMLQSDRGMWLCMFPNEIRLIYPAVMVPANG